MKNIIITLCLLIPFPNGIAEVSTTTPPATQMAPVPLSSHSPDLKKIQKLWTQGNKQEYFLQINEIRRTNFINGLTSPEYLTKRVNDFYVLLYQHQLSDDDFSKIKNHVFTDDLEAKSNFAFTLNAVHFQFHSSSKPEEIRKMHRAMTEQSAKILGELNDAFEPDYKVKYKPKPPKPMIDLRNYQGGPAGGVSGAPGSPEWRRSNCLETQLPLLCKGFSWRLRQTYRDDIPEMKRVYALSKFKEPLLEFLVKYPYLWSSDDDKIIAELNKK